MHTIRRYGTTLETQQKKKKNQKFSEIVRKSMIDLHANIPKKNNFMLNKRFEE